MDFNGFGQTTLTERARCPECGGWFTRATSEHWKRLCLDCFIARKRSQESQQESRIASLHARIEALSERIGDLEEENMALRYRVAELEHGPQAKPQLSRFEGQFMELFTALIRMCHPDRNGGDPAAHKVTVWLLDTREQIRKLSAHGNG